MQYTHKMEHRLKFCRTVPSRGLRTSTIEAKTVSHTNICLINSRPHEKEIDTIINKCTTIIGWWRISRAINSHIRIQKVLNQVNTSMYGKSHIAVSKCSYSHITVYETSVATGNASLSSCVTSITRDAHISSGLSLRERNNNVCNYDDKQRSAIPPLRQTNK